MTLILKIIKQNKVTSVQYKYNLTCAAPHVDSPVSEYAHLVSQQQRDHHARPGGPEVVPYESRVGSAVVLLVVEPDESLPVIVVEGLQTRFFWRRS